MTRNLLGLWMRAGLLTAIIDGAFSGILSAVFYGSTVARLFQGVASTLIGPQALDGGTTTALIGLLMHFGVAFWWSGVFLLLVRRSDALQHALSRPAGVATVAAMYGPFIWLVMSLIVIPFLLERPPSITLRWWVQLLGHIPFVGLPIVASIARGVPAAEGTR